MRDDGQMARRSDLDVFAQQHDLPVMRRQRLERCLVGRVEVDDAVKSQIAFTVLFGSAERGGVEGRAPDEPAVGVEVDRPGPDRRGQAAVVARVQEVAPGRAVVVTLPDASRHAGREQGREERTDVVRLAAQHEDDRECDQRAPADDAPACEIATRNERDGVLALSTEAGVWDELGPHSLEVHPYDVGATAEVLHEAPHDTPVRRLDEATAARKPVLRWKPQNQ